MKKKDAIFTVTMFCLSFMLPHLHRAFAGHGTQRLQLFPLNDEAVSVQWYVKFIGEQVSYIMLLLLCCRVMIVAARHIANSPWNGRNITLDFVHMWVYVTGIVVVFSAIDLVHYLLAFRRIEWLFLAQNGLFVLLATLKIYATFKR